MKNGHEFPKEHGFTGSHQTSKEFRPNVHGFKRGTHAEEMGGGEMLAEGGMPTAHKKNYAHGHRVKHDDHPKHEGHHHTDEHGFRTHKKRKR